MQVIHRGRLWLWPIATGSYAVAGTPKPCHANTAANTAANKANIAVCPGKHTAAASSLQLAAYAKQALPNHVMETQQQTTSCKHSSKQSTHSSLCRQAYICSQLTTTGSYAVAGTAKPCHANTAAYSCHYVHYAPSRSGPIQLVQ